MSFQKFKTDRFCVGGRYRPATTKLVRDKTSKGSKVLFGRCSICKRKQSMTVSDNTKAPEDLAEFFKNVAKKEKRHNASEKIAKNVLKNPERAPEIQANVGTAFASRGPKVALSSSLEVMNFYHTGKKLYLGKMV